MGKLRARRSTMRSSRNCEHVDNFMVLTFLIRGTYIVGKYGIVDIRSDTLLNDIRQDNV